MRLPAAPRVYDLRDQTELRRILMQFMREVERRLRALEDA